MKQSGGCLKKPLFAKDPAFKLANKVDERIRSEQPPAPAPTAAPVRMKRERDQQEDSEPLRPLTLAEVRSRDEETKLFAEHFPNGNVPSNASFLKYVSVFRNPPPWFEKSMSNIATSQNLTFQQVPEFSRSFLAQYRKRPGPNDKLCLNLDRPVTEADGQIMQCRAHILAGYKMREMDCLRNSNYSQNAEYCFFCHLYITNRFALMQHQAVNEKMKKDLMSDQLPADDIDLVIANRFRVQVDQEGEYDSNSMIASTDGLCGIWGYFPFYDEDNFIVTSEGIEERESCLFHQGSVNNELVPSTPTLNGRSLSRSHP
jgi:hypothetical protein